MKKLWASVLISVVVMPSSAMAFPFDETFGAVLFFADSFGGNGQTCGTCHRIDGNQQLAFSPSFASDLFKIRPSDPLFLPINSADTVGTDFSRMFTNGTVPIPIDIPPNVDVEAVDSGAVVHVRSNGSRYILMHRKTPSTLNIALKNELMLDGREGTNFDKQTTDAADTHFGAHQPINASFVDDIVDFELSTFSSESMHDLAQTGEPRALPLPTNSAEAVGYAMMQDSGKCGQCHGGPNLNRTTASNLLDSFFNTLVPGSVPPGLAFHQNVSGNTRFNAPFATHDTDPVYKFVFHSMGPDGHPAPDPLGVMERTIYGADLGAALTSLDQNGNAQPCRPNFSLCILGSPAPFNGFVATFRESFAIPSLWDIGDKIAIGDSFMHHGQAHNMSDVMAIYDDFFAEQQTIAVGFHIPVDPSTLPLTDAEKNGVVAYMTNRMRSSN